MMGDLKVGRPKTATVGGLLAVVTAAFAIAVLSFGLFPEADAELLNVSEAVFTRYLVMAGFVLAGGVLILCRRYRLGGIFALAFSIVLLVNGGFVFIPSIVGGILALRSKEKTPERILGATKL